MAAAAVTRPVTIPARDAELAGDLTVPRDALGIVVFAHGSGSSRHSPRNRGVAGRLVEEGLATLLLDLLTADEDAPARRDLVFDIALLAGRVVDAIDWLVRERSADDLPIGCFGASTGAAAALIAAAERAGRVSAVVSRGGRPDLAGDELASVRAPTLLMVGGLDLAVLELNREAYARMRCEKRLEVIEGAGHLFEEPGALQRVAALAAGWFGAHIAGDTDRLS
jgi:dienelactone hydrolase